MSEIREVHIQRPVLLPNEPFEAFMMQLRDLYKAEAWVKNPVKAHMAIAETKGLKELPEMDMTSQDSETASLFALTYYEHSADTLEVAIDQMVPLGTFGSMGRRALNWFGLNIVKSKELKNDRKRAEKFIASQLGRAPRLRGFNHPHIALGTLTRAAMAKKHELLDREYLEKNGIIVPEKITLTGLRIFLNNKVQEF